MIKKKKRFELEPCIICKNNQYGNVFYCNVYKDYQESALKDCKKDDYKNFDDNRIKSQ